MKLNNSLYYGVCLLHAATQRTFLNVLSRRTFIHRNELDTFPRGLRLH